MLRRKARCSLSKRNVNQAIIRHTSARHANHLVFGCRRWTAWNLFKSIIHWSFFSLSSKVSHFSGKQFTKCDRRNILIYICAQQEQHSSLIESLHEHYQPSRESLQPIGGLIKLELDVMFIAFYATCRAPLKAFNYSTERHFKSSHILQCLTFLRRRSLHVPLAKWANRREKYQEMFAIR